MRRVTNFINIANRLITIQIKRLVIIAGLNIWEEGCHITIGFSNCVYKKYDSYIFWFLFIHIEIQWWKFYIDTITGEEKKYQTSL